MKSLVFVLLILIPVVGCTPATGPTRIEVRGSVALNGVPVEDGQISFLPIEGTVGPVTIERIVGGEYHCERKGGVPIGKHRVEILAWDPKAPYGGRGAPPRPQWVPDQFNVESELTVAIEGPEEPIQRDFNL